MYCCICHALHTRLLRKVGINLCILSWLHTSYYLDWALPHFNLNGWLQVSTIMLHSQLYSAIFAITTGIESALFYFYSYIKDIIVSCMSSSLKSFFNSQFVLHLFVLILERFKKKIKVICLSLYCLTLVIYRALYVSFTCIHFSTLIHDVLFVSSSIKNNFMFLFEIHLFHYFCNTV